MMRRFFLCCGLMAFNLFGPSASAQPLSREIAVDFFRDVPSRNLKGLAARSDGRLVAGPFVRLLTGALDADLLWTLEPLSDNRWLIGSGPDGRVLEVSLDPAGSTFTSRVFAQVNEPQVLALRAAGKKWVLAGTSPQAVLYLFERATGKTIARVPLPADSIFDLQFLDERRVLAATGNPGMIYEIDLAVLAAAGEVAEPVDEASLARAGVKLFGRVRDRNVRRLLVLPDRVVAGSAPLGNLYAFPRTGGDPVYLQDNDTSEVTDLLTDGEGGFYATLVNAGVPSDRRIARPLEGGEGPKDKNEPLASLAAPLPTEKFTGRSSLVWFPQDRFPETLVSRAGLAFYRLARSGHLLLIGAGDQGDLLGYDLEARRSLTYAGVNSAQLNGLVALDERGDRLLAIANNAPELSLIDFRAQGERTALSRPIDLGTPAILGQIHFDRLRSLASSELGVELRTSLGRNEQEGWDAWRTTRAADGAWSSTGLSGRSFQLRVTVPTTAARDLEIDRARLYYLPQNRRPILQSFRTLSPDFALMIRPEASPAPGTTTLAQVIGTPEDKRPVPNSNLLSSPLVPQTGTQGVYWTIDDADNDRLAATFSIRREDQVEWLDVAVDTDISYVQFDSSHLPEGLYFTRLVVREQAPRPVDQRLTVTFETDDLVIDRTPPDIVSAVVERAGDDWIVTVQGRDVRSLLTGIEARFNNGFSASTEQPADGILDGRAETFALPIPRAQTAGATAVEVILEDAAGRTSARRLALPK